MDISVLASVGSFVVSERVLKPKASVLVILGCVLAYDLTTKTHDSVSLRVYRGTIFQSMECLRYAPSCLSHESLILQWMNSFRPRTFGILFNDGCIFVTDVEKEWSCLR
jgi:hypothetical protein